MWLVLRSRFIAGGPWCIAGGEAGSGDLREGSDDGAVFASTVSEFDVAEDFGASKASADDVGCGDLLDAGGCDGNSQACSDESHDGKPLRRLLDDAWAEAVLLAEGDGLFVGKFSGGGREEDEGLATETACRDDAAGCEGMVDGQDGYEGLTEESGDVEAFGGATVAEEAGVESSFEEALHYEGGVGLVKLEVHLGILFAVLAEHGGKRSEHAGADETYAEKAYFATTYAASLREIFLYVLQGAAGAVEKDLAGTGEFYGPGGAGKESMTENVFELANLLG
jgi:hypothetical protein